MSDERKALIYGVLVHAVIREEHDRAWSSDHTIGRVSRLSDRDLAWLAGWCGRPDADETDAWLLGVVAREMDSRILDDLEAAA